MPERTDRRAAERFPVSQDTRCDFAAPVAEPVGPARLQNVSTDGVGLLLSKRVEVGATVVIVVTNSARSFSRTLLVNVVHVTPQVGGTFLVGGTFSTPLTYDELRNLVM
jgi:hypothetical protein